MTWQNPWAWGGLAAVALPILIHLLTRQRARTVRFPTLRFVRPSALMPTRRTRLNDALLLLVRASIIAVAAAALAQPLFPTESRRATASRAIARAIIVDTSASMRYVSADGDTAVSTALRTADSLAQSASSAIIMHTGSAAGELGAAARAATEWTASQRGRGEVVVVSDFRENAFDSLDVALLPPDVTVRLRAISGDSGSIGEAPALTPAQRFDPVIVVGPELAELAQASLEAAYRTGAPQTVRDSAVFFKFSAGDARTPGAIRDRDLADAVARIRADAALADAARAVTTVADPPTIYGDSGVILARALDGRPVAIATSAPVAGQYALVVTTSLPPGTLAAAALISATLRGMREPVSAELIAAPIPRATLRRWERDGTGVATSPPGDDADGRWLWLAVLALIGAETLLRRERLPERQVALDDAA
jgi:hypothetical protein